MICVSHDANVIVTVVVIGVTTAGATTATVVVGAEMTAATETATNGGVTTATVTGGMTAGAVTTDGEATTNGGGVTATETGIADGMVMIGESVIGTATGTGVGAMSVGTDDACAPERETCDRHHATRGVHEKCAVHVTTKICITKFWCTDTVTRTQFTVRNGYCRRSMRDDEACCIIEYHMAHLAQSFAMDHTHRCLRWLLHGCYANLYRPNTRYR